MKAKITKINHKKFSRNGDVFYQRINFQLEDGSFAQTDLVSSFRNYGWWLPVIEAGVGTWIRNVEIKHNGKVDADSRVEITQAPLPAENRPLWPETPSRDGVQRFTVKSRTNPLEVYTVAILPHGEAECDCKGFQYRRYCQHIDLVKVKYTP